MIYTMHHTAKKSPSAAALTEKMLPAVLHSHLKHL